MFSGHPTKNNHRLIARDDSNEITQKQNKQTNKYYSIKLKNKTIK